MKPENHVLWTTPLLNPLAGVHALYLAVPGMPLVDSRDKLRADSIAGGNLFLDLASFDSLKNSAVAGIQIVHPLLDSRQDLQGVVGSLGLYLNKRANSLQQQATIVAVGECVGVKLLELLWSFVCLNSTVSEPVADSVQCRLEDVGDADTDSTLFRVNLNTPFTVQHSSQITVESVFRKAIDVHTAIIRSGWLIVCSGFSMAVPVLRWIGERIEAVEKIKGNA